MQELNQAKERLTEFFKVAISPAKQLSVPPTTLYQLLLNLILIIFLSDHWIQTGEVNVTWKWEFH